MKKAFYLLAFIAFVAVSGCSQLPSTVTSDISSDKLILVNFSSTNSLDAWATGQSYTYGSKNWQRPAHLIKPIKQIGKDYQLTEVDDWPIKSLDLYCVLFRVDNDQSIAEVLKRINDDSRVAFAEQLEGFQLMMSKPEKQTYSDPLLDVQHPNATSLIKSLHQLSTGSDIKVGIIDSAVDNSHPDLDGRIHQQQSFIDPSTSSSFEHGTAVAGIIGASADNMEGIAGLAPDAYIYAYEACGHRNNNTFCDSFTLAKAFEHALHDNLDILNLSLAGAETPLLRALVDKLLSNGVILIAAENSESRRNFPAQVDGVYSASNKMADSYWFANNEQLSTQAGGGYRFFYGTSISAAGMTGFSAALSSIYKVQEVSAILDSMSRSDCDTLLSQLPVEIQQIANHLCPANNERPAL